VKPQDLAAPLRLRLQSGSSTPVNLIFGRGRAAIPLPSLCDGLRLFNVTQRKGEIRKTAYLGIQFYRLAKVASRIDKIHYVVKLSRGSAYAIDDLQQTKISA